MKSEIAAFCKAVELVGGIRPMASVLGVFPQAIYHWMNGARRIPAERCPEIERATDGAVRCEELRQDVAWDVLREQSRRVAHSKRKQLA